MEILCGHVYRAKRPKPSGSFFEPVFDDRSVLYISEPLFGEPRVQYDSPTVRSGRKYPMVDRSKFERWAGQDVTEGYPDDGWAPWKL